MALDVADYLQASLGQLIGLRASGVVNEVYVVDSGSIDTTALEAENYGAKVLPAASIRPEFGRVLGKGDAMWRAASVIDEDVIVFLDADIDGDLANGVRKLIEAVRPQGRYSFVKGYFRRAARPREANGEFSSDLTPGGRVTEYLVRPLFATLAPEFSHFREPLSGQVAITRSLMWRLPVVTDYGVEIGMLIDTVQELGHDGIGEVDLGVIYNPPVPDSTLEVIAQGVTATLMARLAHAGRFNNLTDLRARSIEGALLERPPLISVT